MFPGSILLNSLNLFERQIACVYAGFGDRLLNEVRKLAPKDMKIRISAPPERKFSTWIGGYVESVFSVLFSCYMMRFMLLLAPGLFWRHLLHSKRCGFGKVPKYRNVAYEIIALTSFCSFVEDEYEEEGAAVVHRKTL